MLPLRFLDGFVELCRLASRMPNEETGARTRMSHTGAIVHLQDRGDARSTTEVVDSPSRESVEGDDVGGNEDNGEGEGDGEEEAVATWD